MAGGDVTVVLEENVVYSMTYSRDEVLGMLSGSGAHTEGLSDAEISEAVSKAADNDPDLYQKIREDLQGSIDNEIKESEMTFW